MEMPIGTIILWKHGNIPAGWALYQPAVGRFLRGASQGSNPGVTGGAETHVHTLGQISVNGDHVHGNKDFIYPAPGGHAVQGPGSQSIASSDHEHSSSFSMGSAGAHGHSNSATDTGAASSMPQHKIARFIIKV
jgi:hypothetical protein